MIEAQASICEYIRVVVGAYYRELEDHISMRHPGVEIVFNERWEDGGMFSSVQLGLAGVDNAAFIQPSDIPGPTGEVYEALKLAFENDTSSDFIKPIYENKGGHPILLSKRVLVKDFSKIIVEHRGNQPSL